MEEGLDSSSSGVLRMKEKLRSESAGELFFITVEDISRTSCSLHSNLPLHGFCDGILVLAPFNKFRKATIKNSNNLYYASNIQGKLRKSP